MAHAVLRPNVIRFLEFAFADESTDIHIEEITISKSSKLAEVSLKESGIRQNYNLNILSMVKADGTMVFNPSADTQICGGGSIIAVGGSEDLVKLEAVLNP
jgi:voltage-gated potassium channel